MGVTPTSPQIQQAPSNMAEWKSGNCDCCALGCGGCLMHTYCFPCALYQTGERQGGQGVMYAVISLFFPCIPIMMARNKARETHNIEGSRGGRLYGALLPGLRQRPGRQPGGRRELLIGREGERGNLEIEFLSSTFIYGFSTHF